MIDQLIAPASGGNILLHPEWTPRARQVLSASREEAASYGFSQAGTEHILLAMLAETDCVACRLLFTMGVKMQRMYSSLLNVLGIDEKEMGIYGGNLPWDVYIPSPRITKCNVAAKTTADGKLSVDIEVKAAE